MCAVRVKNKVTVLRSVAQKSIILFLADSAPSGRLLVLVQCCARRSCTPIALCARPTQQVRSPTATAQPLDCLPEGPSTIAHCVSPVCSFAADHAPYCFPAPSSRVSLPSRDCLIGGRQPTTLHWPPIQPNRRPPMAGQRWLIDAA